MSRSQPFDLLNIYFRPVWEASRKEKYRITGRDLREAKEFLAGNPEFLEEENSIVEFQEHTEEFLKSTFDGWRNQNYPAWGLLKYYNTYIPKRKREHSKSVMIPCIDCGTIHSINQDCPKCFSYLK